MRRDLDATPVTVDPLALADREEAISDWLEARGVVNAWRIAPPLAAAGVDVDWCVGVATILSPDTLEPGLDWVAGTLSTRSLLSEVKDSTARISGLVDAVKSYSQLDRASLQVIDVTEGIDSSLVMLSHKLGEDVTVVRDYAADAPRIEAIPSELNQVWTNLIDNAIDAMEGSGTLRISTPDRTGRARGRDRRHRAGHAAGGAGPGVRALLHDEGGRPGYRVGPRHLAADHRRPAPRHHHHRGESGRHRVAGPPPPRPGRHRRHPARLSASRGQDRPVRYRFGDTVLDTTRYQLRRGDEFVHVEPQVFDVLAHLVEHRDRVVTKSELLETVWGHDFVSESALTTRIKQLRQAVGDTGRDQRVVQTVHGRGYRFIAPVEEESGDGERPILAVPPDLRQDIHFCTATDGTRIAYATVGTGPPLVRAAHWITHLDYDWQSPVWRHWLVGLARGRQFIRYDERGCGLSAHDVDDFSIDAFVRDLEAVVDDLALERFPLLGVSQGGPIAISYAARHPERVSHLILLGAYAHGRLRRATTEEQRREALLQFEIARRGLGSAGSHLPALLHLDVHP